MGNTASRTARRRSNQFLEVLTKIGKFIAVVAIIAAVIGALLAGTTYYFLRKARAATPAIVAKIKATRQPMPVSDLSGEELAWLLQVEDPSFYSHKGYDFSTPGAGYTTLTQAIVKPLYFKDFTPYLDKLPQVVDAYVLNQQLSKEDQLRYFINTVYLGQSREHEVHGFKEAAHWFFDKRFDELNKDEYLSIVAMIIDPDAYHIQAEPYANVDRVNRIKKMLDGRCKAAGPRDVLYKNCN